MYEKQRKAQEAIEKASKAHQKFANDPTRKNRQALQDARQESSKASKAWDNWWRGQGKSPK
ncbi:MAG: hypothetical protein ACRCSN_19675 [Dermatophilaceae bacterium]